VSAPIFPTLQADPVLATKKKRILLVDSSRAKRDLRSETMRRLGAEVDCAADISEARCWWRADLYDLVLMNVDSTSEQRDKFCDDIRRIMPHQQIMFLVGKPEYLAASPNSAQSLSLNEAELEAALLDQVKTPIVGDGSKPASQVWGILEACRRISAVRSAMDARSRAIRDRPAPTRDADVSRTRPADEVQDFVAMTELIREETQ
jgi:CheY-like chemotaxis protein